MPKFKIKGLTKIPPMRVKYKDIFDMKAFYEALHEWLLENGWQDLEERGAIIKDHWESYYNEKVDRSGAKEIWIRWRTFKRPPDTEGINYYLDFDFHNVALVPTEIVKDGQKIKANKGELDLFIKAAIEEEYKGKFGKNKFLKYFQDIFSSRVYKKIFEQRKKELYQEAYTVQAFIKQWFKMKRYLPYEEGKVFQQSKAWPSHIKDK